jgi:hypothetical protein
MVTEVVNQRTGIAMAIVKFVWRYYMQVYAVERSFRDKQHLTLMDNYRVYGQHGHFE